MAGNESRTEALLTEIRDLQKESLELARRQFDRAEALHTRAERIQDRSESIMGVARKSLFVILPVIAGLLAYLTWLVFR